MIYYKRRSWIKKLILKITRSEVSLPPVFSFLKAVCVFLFGSILVLYSAYLFLLPKFITEVRIENFLNNYLSKNTKLALDVDNLQVLPNYKFDINIKADSIKLKYPNKKDFVTVKKFNAEISLITLCFKYIDLNKIKADKIIINTNFTKSKRYSCFDYFDLDILKFDNLNADFKLRNINILTDSFVLNLFDENIKKSFYIKANGVKLSSSPNKPFLITTKKGVIASSNHKICDYNLKLELLLKKNLFDSFKKIVQKLNYNPLIYADKYQFYSIADINLKVIHTDKKSETLGSAKLKDYSFKVEGITLPKNNILILFKGDKIKADCNFNFIKDQFIKLNLNASINKNKYLEVLVNSNDINLSEIKGVIEAFLKIINPKINSNEFILSGLVNCNMHLKSDFSSITSSGNLLIKNAKLSYRPLNLALENINSNINFDNNKINILTSSAYVDKSKFYLTGSIDNKTNLNLKINSEPMNIVQFMALIQKLPLDLKLNDYIFKTGLLKLNATVLGTAKKPLINAHCVLSNFKVFIKPYKTTLSLNEILIDSKVEKDIFITLFVKLPLNNGLVVVKHKNPILKANLVLSKTKLIIQELNIFDNNKKLLVLNGSIDNFETLNNIKINIIEKISLLIPVYSNLSLEATGSFNIWGKIKNPDLTGNLTLYNVRSNDLNLYIKDIVLNIKNSSAYINIINAKIMDFDFDLVASAKYLNNKIIVSMCEFNSPYINLDKVEKYSNKLKTLPNVQVDNVIGRISSLEAMSALVNSVYFEGKLNNDILTIQKFSAEVFNGSVSGSLNINLKNYKTRAEIILKEINVRYLSSQLKELSIAASGKLSALITADFTGLDFDNLIKTLDGYIKFNINDGELNQFAKLERFLQAGNILSQSVLKLTLNSTISAVTNKNTGDFKTIEGTIKIKDALANIQYIKTQGTNMSMYITGRFNLLTKYANLKVFGRIPSSIVSVLGNIGSFSGGKLVDKMSEDAKEIIKTITVSPIERLMSAPMSDEDVKNIPPLVNQIDGTTTREFFVLISGTSQSASAVKYFKWRQRD